MRTKVTKDPEAEEAKRILADAQQRPGAVIEDLLLPEGFGWPKLRLSNVTFRRAVFTNSTIFGRLLRHQRFDRCRFESCVLDGLKARFATWSECSFHAARTSQRWLGAFEHCEFKDVLFESCTLNELSFFKCSFVRCRFVGIVARRMRLEKCRVENSTATGQLREALLCDNRYQHFDLTGIDIGDSTFIGSVRGLSLPQRPESFAVPSSAFAVVSRSLAGKLSRELQADIEVRARIAAPGLAQGIALELFKSHSRLELDMLIGELFKNRVRS